MLAFQNSTFEGKHGIFEGVGSLRVPLLAARQGFEPRFPRPERGVLPLHHQAIIMPILPQISLHTPKKS